MNRHQTYMMIGAALSILVQTSAPGWLRPAVANQNPQDTTRKVMAEHPYAGMWVTDDGRIRHELLPDGRYDEARGNRESAYRGRYEVTGNLINYWDDTGFTADGVFIDQNTLHHGGMTFRRQ